MNRAFLLCASVAGLVGAGFLACNPNSIGRPCVNPQGSAVLGTQVSSPALECPSRLCLIQPASASGGVDGGAPRATCTATCNHDSDCDAETLSQCPAKFVCAVATTAGPFCCEKVCICKSDLQAGVNVDPDGGTILPHSCDPATYQGSGTTPQCPHVKL
jgi:hypothetical protein